MVFLFVGSSALTEASFPRDLAIPQLLLSSAWTIVLTMKASATAVFPHRGFTPHQFTPMSGAHQALQRTRPSRSRCNPRVPRAGSLSSYECCQELELVRRSSVYSFRGRARGGLAMDFTWGKV
jgi:hypothetical protein